MFAPEELSVAGFGDADLAEHLAHDDLDVLVVDRHTLQTINFLHFVDQVFLQLLRAADVEDFVRVHRTFGQLLTFLHEVALEHDDVLTDGDEMFLFELSDWILDENATLTAHARTEVHDAVNLGDFRCVFRTTRFEQFGHTRQTAGDVFRLRLLTRRLGHQCSCDNLVAGVHNDVRAGRNRVAGDGFALVVTDDDLRMQIFFVVNDNHGFLLGRFVHFLFHRHAFDDVVELHMTRLLRENRHVIRIPLDEGFTLLHPT